MYLACAHSSTRTPWKLTTSNTSTGLHGLSREDKRGGGHPRVRLTTSPQALAWVRVRHLLWDRRRDSCTQLQPSLCVFAFASAGTSHSRCVRLTCPVCKECYTNFVETKLGDGEARRIGCMQNDCSVVLDEKTVEILLDDEKRAKYSSLLDRTYVDDNPWLRWCPAPDCQNAVECQVPDRMLESVIPTVICACGNVFCFGCSREDHRPANCLVVKKWAKKCADDSETANWISTNTKECPKCHSTIEKNGGCNHMTCKKCRHEFCWVCMGPWSEHGQAYYNCNRFNDSDKPDHSKQRLSLERYLHYYNRFANHEQSIRLEQELYARIERKMDELQQNSSLSWIEAQFLAKAVETLSVCRTTLKWTYAMAFYLAKNNTTAMFLDNQRCASHAPHVSCYAADVGGL